MARRHEAYLVRVRARARVRVRVRVKVRVGVRVRVRVRDRDRDRAWPGDMKLTWHIGLQPSAHRVAACRT